MSSKLITRRFSNREGSGALEGGSHNMNSHNMLMSGIASGGGGLVRQTGRIGSRGMMSKESGALGGMRSRGLGGLLGEGAAPGDYEEDLQAEILKQKEEQEAAAFKRFFHGRIKAMSCMKKIKHVSLVLFIAAIVQAYFLVKRSMILSIEQQIRDSLTYYKIFADRGELFGCLMTEFRESYSRNTTFPAPVNSTANTSLDYFLSLTLQNE